MGLRRAALTYFRELGDSLGHANAATQLGAVRQLTGDYEGAVRDLETGQELYRKLGQRIGRADALTDLGAVRLQTGDLPGAARDFEAALQLFREVGAVGNEVWALTQYAAVFTALGDDDRALELYREALGLGEEALALAQAGLGECLARHGQVRDATAYLELAFECFGRLGMKLESERVQACLTELGARPAELLSAALELAVIPDV